MEGGSPGGEGEGEAAAASDGTICGDIEASGRPIEGMRLSPQSLPKYVIQLQKYVDVDVILVVGC